MVTEIKKTTIKDLRLARDMTQQELAEATGLSVQIIGRVERNNPDHPVSKGNFLALCYYFSISPDEVEGVPFQNKRRVGPRKPKPQE